MVVQVFVYNFGFQVTGMIKGYFGFEIFDSGIFWEGKQDEYFFGYSKQFEDLW